MTTKVDFWFDTLCPFAWMTSRWILEAEQVRDIEVHFHTMCLAYLNQDKDIPDDYRKGLAPSWPGARAAVIVEKEHGQQAVRDFYTAIGTRYHPQDEPRTIETLRAALADVGLPDSIADRAQTDEADDLVRASHHEGMDLVGDEVGTPVVHVNGMGLFGPVVSPAPKGEDAGNLWDGFEKMTAYPGFFEVKRSRTVGPIFD